MEIRMCCENDIAEVGRFYDKAVLHLCQTTNYPKWQYKVYPSEMSVREKTSVNQQFVCLDGEEIVGAFVLNDDPQGKYENAEWTTNLLWGEYIASMGVAFSTKAGLGTSPVASVPYSVSLVFPIFTLGGWLIKDIAADTYVQQLAYMVLSCFILAFGIWIQLKGNVAMLPGEAMNRAISMVTGKKYENIKIFFDVFYIIIAAVICLVFLGRLEGVREGSIFATIAVGSIIKFYNGIFD